MEPQKYFLEPKSVAQKQYCALAAFFKEALPAKTVAREYGYTLTAFYSLVRDFTRRLSKNPGEDLFFKEQLRGRRGRRDRREVEALVLSLRAKFLSNTQIKSILEALGVRISMAGIWKILNGHGVEKLRRRSRAVRAQAVVPHRVAPPECVSLSSVSERFSSSGGVGVFVFAGIVNALRLIPESDAPHSTALLSALALKLANVHPQADGNLWRFDRGLGLFAGLNVLPDWESLVAPLSHLPRGMVKELRERLSTESSRLGVASADEGGVIHAMPSLMATRGVQRRSAGVSMSGRDALYEIDFALSLVARHCHRLLERHLQPPHPAKLWPFLNILAGAGGEFEISESLIRIRPANDKLSALSRALYQGAPIHWLNNRRLEFLSAGGQ